MRNLPPLAAIRVFEAAGRLEHFSRAAEELGMTQAAVSYQIRQLEQRLDTVLFKREKGRVRLNAAGRRLHPTISEAFAAMHQAFADLERDESRILGVTAPVSLGTSWLSETIGEFQLKYPDLAVRLSVSNALTDFARGEVDCGIRIGGGDYAGLRSHFLFRLFLVPCCSPEYASNHKLRKPVDLLETELINASDPLWREYFSSAGLHYTADPTGALTLENQAQEINVALAGQGVALLTPLFWRREIDSGRLVMPIDHVYISGLSHWLVHGERRIGVRKIERFREWLSEALANPVHDIPAEALEPPRRVAVREQRD